MQIWDFSVLWFTDICLLNLFYSYLCIHSAAVVKGWVIYPKQFITIFDVSLSLCIWSKRSKNYLYVYFFTTYTHTHTCMHTYISVGFIYSLHMFS